MKTLAITFVISLFFFANFPQRAFAQERPPDAIYIIFDASGSMWGKLPDKTTKIDVAKNALQDFVVGDFEGYELAFRVYGHRQKEDCSDSQLVITFGAAIKVVSELRDFMKTVNPLGKTPITYSLREALKDFGDRRGEIILITDGIETCEEDPCALVQEWKEKDVKIKVHVVGFGLDEKAKEAMKCISEAAGTEHHDASSASELREELTKIQEKG